MQPKCIPVDNHGVVEEMAPLGCQIRHAVLRAYVRGISSAGPAGLDAAAVAHFVVYRRGARRSLRRVKLHVIDESRDGRFAGLLRDCRACARNQ